MARFVWNGTEFVDRDGNPMVDRSAPYVPCVPQIMRDIPEYRSPINGKPITSRSERRDDLARNGCREWDAADSPTKGKFKNARFAAKHGHQVSEEFRDHSLNKPHLEGA